jgi:hypothetical protein
VGESLRGGLIEAIVRGGLHSIRPRTEGQPRIAKTCWAHRYTAGIAILEGRRQQQLYLGVLDDKQQQMNDGGSLCEGVSWLLRIFVHTGREGDATR